MTPSEIKSERAKRRRRDLSLVRRHVLPFMDIEDRGMVLAVADLISEVRKEPHPCSCPGCGYHRGFAKAQKRREAALSGGAK